MSRCINRATLLGHVGQEPEVRAVNDGRVATFSLATSVTWIGEGGQRQEKTEWHRVVAWNKGNAKLADTVEKFVGKGDRVHVEGPIRYRSFEDKDGVKRYVTEIEAKDIILLSARGAAAEDDKPASGVPAGSKARASSPAPAAGRNAGPIALDDDDDDDLPF